MILDNDHAKRKASQEKRILRVNPTVNIIPIHLVSRNVDAARLDVTVFGWSGW